MAVTYPNATKVARMTAVRDLIDGGATPGRLEIGSAAMAAVLATIALSAVCGTVGGAGVLTFSDFPKSDTDADASGTAAAARIVDGDGVVIISGLTVGLTSSGADIELDSVTLTAGQTVTVSSGTITHAA